jgi:hypothetical protein
MAMHRIVFAATHKHAAFLNCSVYVSQTNPLMGARVTFSLPVLPPLPYRHGVPRDNTESVYATLDDARRDIYGSQR